MNETVIQIDTIHASVGNIPADASAVAGYVTGTPDIQWTAVDFARFSSERTGIVRIDQSPSLSALAAMRADVGDIETGAATIPAFVAAARERALKGHQTFAYVTQAGASALADALGDLQPMVQLWLANWNLSEAGAASLVGAFVGKCRIVAVQFASPSSNPHTILPGSNLSLAQADCDLSVKLASWFGPVSPPVVTPGVVVSPSLRTFSVRSTDLKTWVAAPAGA